MNARWFRSLGEAQTISTAWWDDYNHERPHSALGGLTPMEYERAQLRTRADQARISVIWKLDLGYLDRRNRGLIPG